MIAAIFVVPLVYFLNAFLIGRWIKRARINVNPFLATIIGFVAFFDLIYFVTIWMYAGHTPIWVYFLVLGIIQVILIALYIANWKYIFITWSVKWRKIINFSIAVGLTILISWLCVRNFNSEFGTTWKQTMDALPFDIWKPIQLRPGSYDVVSNFSSFNIMNAIWIHMFQVKNIADSITFCNWSWTIIAAGFIGCLSTWILGENKSNSRLVLSLLFTLIFVVLILAFIESFAIGDAWVLMLLLAYILILVKSTNTHSIKLFMLTTLLLGFLAASCTSFYVVICVWLFTIYYAIRNKENSFNYILFLSWPLFLSIFSILSIYTFWLLSLMDAVYIVFAIILIAIYRKFGIPVWDTKIALSIHRHSGKIVYIGLGLLIALILVANFFIFQEIYDWNPSKIDYHNFLTFTYSYVWSFNITSTISVAIFNASMYAIFVAFTIAYLVIRKMKKNKLNPLFKTDSAMKFGIISCILFINPLVIHVLKMSTVQFPLNTLDLNMLFVIPIFVGIYKTIFNYKLVSIREWKYDWY